jgi:hypothetical protein
MGPSFETDISHNLRIHYLGQDYEMPISEKLSPMHPYHTRQIFLRTIKNMNIKDANELIDMFDCESDNVNKNCLFNSDHTETNINDELYKNKYLKYKAKYQNLKKLL